MIGSIRTSEPVFHYRLPRLQSVDGHFCPDRLSYPEENRQSSHLKLSNLKGRKKARLSFIQRCFNVALLFLTASVFAIITGIGYGDVSLFLSSIFAVLGVAFIAQWSILSNITASFLIFLSSHTEWAIVLKS